MVYFRPDDNRLVCIMMGMFYADCCQTFMNWFPEIGVTCSTSDGAFGNACAITYTTLYRFLPFALGSLANQANNDDDSRSVL